MKFKGVGLGPNLDNVVVAVLTEQNCRSVDLTDELAGKLIICLGRVDPELTHKAMFLGIAGLVFGGIHYTDWKKLAASESSPTLLMLGRFGDEKPDQSITSQLLAMNKKTATLRKETNNSYELEINS